MEYEKSYVFEPSQTRPSKRRKIETTGLHASWPLRRVAYRKAWHAQEKAINDRLESINTATISEIASFLDSAQSTTPEGKIPTGVISIGPDASSQIPIFKYLAHSNSLRHARAFVALSASSGTNLKALLKTIILKATSRQDSADGDDDGDEADERVMSKKGAKLLNYDLQILADYVREHHIAQIVLAFQDTEAFDSHLLSDLIETLGFWHDRIPFVFLFSIATSLDFLQQRLSKDAVKYLHGRLFDVAPSDAGLEQVLEAVTSSDARLWIGADLMAMALERQGDYIQSLDSLTDYVRYAYMSCYYANPLSIFLDPMVGFKDVPADHFAAVRNLDSFQHFCYRLLREKQLTRVKDLLDEDEILFGMVRLKVEEGREALANLVRGTHVVRELQRHLPQQQAGSLSKLYVQAVANKMDNSSLIRSLLLSIRKVSSEVVTSIIAAVCDLDLSEGLREKCAALKTQLSDLLASTNANDTLRSEDDVRNSTLRTTVVAQKVELSKQKSTLSKQDAAYTTILRAFTDLLEHYFHDVFVNPRDLAFHEIFLYDLKSPHREVFAPRPRHAIERALAAPHDYLACACCAPKEGEGDEATLAACQPATAVLYQLYLESGGLINASDLWQAFRAVVGDERTEEEQDMALFQRALAELKYLGFVKGTRKRIDHVAKIAWRGL